MKNKRLAVIGLFAAAVLGGISPIAAKFSLKEFGPVTITFIRFFSSFIILSAISLSPKKIVDEIRHDKRLIIVGLLFAGNILMFINGIKYTTSIVSQIMYLLSPLVVLLWSLLLLRKPIHANQIIGMIFGIIGAGLLIFRGKNILLTNSIGTLNGNVLVLFAVISWGSYLFFAKKLANSVNPATLLMSNSLITFLAALPFLVLELISNQAIISHISLVGIVSLLFLIFINSILMFFLYQWCLKYASAFTTSSATYVSPLATAMLAIPLLGEHINLHLIVSSLFIVISSYLTIIHPQLSKRK